MQIDLNKNFNKMKKTIFSFVAVISLMSCGGIKTPTGEVDVYIPCQSSDFSSNKNFFRAFGNGISNNPTGAMQDAEDMAKGQLALDIESKVKVVSERYSENITDGMKGNFTSVSERLGRQIARQTIGKTKNICSKTTRDKSSGMFKHYMTIEMAVDDIVKEYADKFDEESKGKIRVNRDKFRAIFNEELN